MVTVPDDLAAALAGDDGDATAAFAAMSYTHQREYVEWIDEAKRPATRARRVAGTVERVRAGRTADARHTGRVANSTTVSLRFRDPYPLEEPTCDDVSPSPARSPPWP